MYHNIQSYSALFYNKTQLIKMLVILVAKASSAKLLTHHSSTVVVS